MIRVRPLKKLRFFSLCGPDRGSSQEVFLDARPARMHECRSVYSSSGMDGTYA